MCVCVTICNVFVHKYIGILSIRAFNLYLYVCVSRSQPARSPGEEDETKEEEGLFSGRSGEAGVEGHE